MLAFVAVCAGLGWLYLLRDTRALAAGPMVSRSLPLEELAGSAAQPLLRMAVAWLPAGLAAGFALALFTRMRALAIAVSAGVLAFVLLFATTAASESVANNERLSPHLVPALGRHGVWVATAFVIIGALPAARVRAWARRDRPPEPTTMRPTSSSAA